jgi:hypothetical protein
MNTTRNRSYRNLSVKATWEVPRGVALRRTPYFQLRGRSASFTPACSQPHNVGYRRVDRLWGTIYLPASSESPATRRDVARGASDSG